jgi:primosomal protein N' (replication factor Y)
MSKLLFQDAGSGSEYQAWFAEVILPVAVQGTFTYRVPSDYIDAVKPGQRIAVQFGKKKIYTAVIVSLHQDPPKGYTAKYFLEILDEEPVVSEMQLRFWQWIADYYCCTMGEVMDAALPANMKLESESKIVLHPEAELLDIPLTDKEGLVMVALRKEKELPIGKISEILDQKTVLPIVKSMYEKGLIVLKEELTETYRIKTETFVTHAVELEDSEDRQALFKILEAAPKQSDVLLAYVTMMREGKPIMKRKLLKMANAPASSLDALESKGILSTYEAEVDRVNEERASSPEFTLNEDQAKAIAEIKESFQKQDVVLLHGVTGSGKTHVYMQLINETLAEGKQALYLVPEIALTAQLIGRLRATYGEKIGIYHSKFSSDERMEIWNKVRNGSYQVVMGVRSALFKP